MHAKVFSVAKKILPLIGISLFIYLIYSLDPQKILNEIMKIPLHIIILSSLLTIPRVLIRNSAWMMLHKKQKINVSYWRSLKIFLMGYFYGSFTPGYVGQLMRIPYLKEQTNEPYGKLFVNSFIETTLHLLSMYALMFVGALVILQEFPEVFYAVCIWIGVVCFFLWIFLHQGRGEKTLHFFGKKIFLRLLFFLPTQLKQYMKSFVKTFYQDFPKLRSLVPPMLIASVTWIIIFSQEYLIAWSLDPNIPYLYFLVLVPIANMAGILPISIAGIGIRELTAIILFTTLGVPDTTVFVFTLVGFVITDVLTGFVGFLLTLTETRKTMTISPQMFE